MDTPPKPPMTDTSASFHHFSPTRSSSLPATMASTTDQQRRDRIVTHMNSAHKRQLSHYLRYFAGLSSSAASSPTLTDVSLHSLFIRAHDNSDHIVPFSPPLSTWDDIRPRVVAMDALARHRLGGISEVQITAYARPRGFDWVVFGGVLWYFFNAATLPLVVPGSRVWDILTVVFPGGPLWFRWIVRAIFVPVVALHLTEAVLFDRKRMQRHGVQRWSGLWWKWELSCFIEGLAAWHRIDGIIAQKKTELEAKKH